MYVAGTQTSEGLHCIHEEGKQRRHELPADSPFSRQVISLGGQIGAGLFISSGKNLLNGGPGNLLLGFAVVCSCVWALHQTLGEMTIAFPVSGNFIEFADRFVDPAFSFAAGFSMWLGWTAIIAAEAVFFNTVINYWARDHVPEAALSKKPPPLPPCGALFPPPLYSFHATPRRDVPRDEMSSYLTDST
ncbi:hypothetical protein VTK73DRAFT_2585 [Phialemonium thermophilum]|uniref:Amino acid permease/ SLC12A domain-containing protein n=1 Tax=Phialemonium thermophilum TaxID=223376 RepID=A0ABR3VRY8_9PEZI